MCDFVKSGGRGETRLRRSAGAALLLLGLLTPLCARAEAGREEKGPPSLANEEAIQSDTGDLIVEVRFRGDMTLTDAILVYLTPDRKDVLVPLEEIALLLEFPIKQTETGAEGWLIEESRRFRYDRASSTISFDGAELAIEPEQASLIDGELFIAANALSAALPLNFELNPRALILNVASDEVTAIDERRLREERRRQGYGSVMTSRSVLEPYDHPFQLLSAPSVKFNGSLGYTKNDGEDGALGAVASTRAYGDFFFMNGELYVAASDEDVTNARVELERYDPRGGVLGPLDATRFALGDISSAPLPLVSSGYQGRGVRLTSNPRNRAGLNRVTLADVVEPNFEVELYRNDILIAADRTDASGAYRFDDIPLLSGANELRLEFYGPQGQRRTEIERYEAGTQTNQGEFDYDFSLSEVGRSVFGFRDDEERYGDMTLGGAFSVAYGVTNDLSVTAGVAAAPVPLETEQGGGVATPSEDDHRFYGALGLLGRFDGVTAQGDVVTDDSAGVAVALSASTVFSIFDLSVGHEHFLNGFRSDVSASDVSGPGLEDDDNEFRSSRTYSRLGWSSRNVIPETFFSGEVAAGYEEFEEGDGRLTLSNDLALNRWRIGAGNTLRYSSGGGDSSDDLDGAFRLNLSFDQLSLRASAGYEVEPSAQVDFVSFGMNSDIGYDLDLNAGYSRDFGEELSSGGETSDYESYYLGVSRDFGVADIGIQGQYSNYDDDELSDGYSVFLTLSFSTFTDDSTLATRVSSRDIARRGAVRALSFVDSDGNGVWDEGERRVEGVAVYSGARSPAIADSNGEAFAVGLPVDSWVDIGLDPGSVSDPSLQPATAGRAILPRPGATAEIALPLVEVGDVTGAVQVRDAQGVRPLANATVQLRSMETGEVVRDVVSEFDGVYFISGAPVGKYLLSLDPEQATRLSISSPPSIVVEIDAKVGLLEGIDLIASR